MRTRNSYFPNNSSVTISRRQNKRRTPNVVELELRTIIEMADNHTMEELLQAPMEGYGEAIVIPEINANHFEIKTNLLQQIDTSYNGLNDNDQDSLNAAAGGNLLSKTTREALQIIKNKSKVRYSRNKSNVSRMNTTSRENDSRSDDRIGMDVCHALADLVASINLMPLSIWEKFSLTELTPTRMTLDRSSYSPPFKEILLEDRSCFNWCLWRKITLRVNDEAVTFNLNQTTRYSSTYDDLSVNRIDIIDVAREEYAQEILSFSNNSSSGNPTLTFEPILSDSFPSLTPFEGSDFILQEIDAYLKDESISAEIDLADCDLEGYLFD
nr:reverse transcriptase domain-containing protein [Tanacetum cinerariifolium]